MNKRIYILLVAFCLTSTGFGQFVGKDDLSISLFYLQKSELDSARKYIDLAAEDNALKTGAKTWYYRGYIYKESYKKSEKLNKISPLRMEAIESFKQMLKRDGKEEFQKSTFKMLNFLANTLYNDAARMLNPENFEASNNNYNLFKSTMLLIDPKLDFKEQDIKYKLALASMLNRPAEQGQALKPAHEKMVLSLYSEVLEINPNNGSANYNLAIIYYNKAADIINDMGYDMDIAELNEVQDRCIDIFLEGLPYMKKAHEMNYKREATLLGLSNIYRGLNDLPKSDAYKKELEDLEKE